MRNSDGTTETCWALNAVATRLVAQATILGAAADGGPPEISVDKHLCQQAWARRVMVRAWPQESSIEELVKESRAEMP